MKKKKLAVIVCLVVVLALSVLAIGLAGNNKALAIVEPPTTHTTEGWVLERAKWGSAELNQKLWDGWEPFGVDKNIVYLRKYFTTTVIDE